MTLRRLHDVSRYVGYAALGVAGSCMLQPERLSGFAWCVIVLVTWSAGYTAGRTREAAR